MSKLFKRRGSRMVQQSSETKPETVSLDFSANHPFLEKCSEIQARSVVTDQKYAEDFHKFNLFFRRYIEFIDLIRFYFFPNKTDREFITFRDNAKKAQIEKGLTVILKFDENMKILRYQHVVTRHPLEYMSHLFESRKYWGNAKIVDHKEKKVFNGSHKLLRSLVNKRKQACVYLLSLLSSYDVIPNNYITVINFDELLNYTVSGIAAGNEHCRKLKNINDFKQNQYNIEITNHIQKIIQLRDNYKEQNYSKCLISILNKYRNDFYDEENQCFRLETDITLFHDFVTHPNVPSFQMYEEYKKAPSATAYKKFIGLALEKFEIKMNSPESLIFHDLCSLSFAYSQIPLESISFPDKVKEDFYNNFYNSFSNNEIDEVAFQVFVAGDPISTLNIIKSSMPHDESNQNYISQLIDSLKQITPIWKEILLYVFEYTHPDCMRADLNSIRSLIRKLL